MKIRCGFVSNSSSSSFIIKNQAWNDCKITSLKMLKERLMDCINFYNDMFENGLDSKPLEFDKVFGVITTGKNTKQLIKGFQDNYYGNGEDRKTYYEDNVEYESKKTYLEMHQEGDFVIFSRNENTIPYRLIEIINAVFQAEHFSLS